MEFVRTLYYRGIVDVLCTGPARVIQVAYVTLRVLVHLQERDIQNYNGAYKKGIGTKVRRT